MRSVAAIESRRTLWQSSVAVIHSYLTADCTDKRSMPGGGVCNTALGPHKLHGGGGDNDFETMGYVSAATLRVHSS